MPGVAPALDGRSDAAPDGRIARVDRSALDAATSAILARRPAVGLAIGMVRRGDVALSSGGMADIDSATAVTPDTVFRVGSITKTFTAVAVMQLHERGLIDLDAPASRCLRAYRLDSGRWPVPTVRHLLTHTSGISDVLHATDLLRSALTPDDGRPPLLSVPAGAPLPSLAAYYEGALPVAAKPGRAFAYCNHGFATLGQIVEDLTGQPLDRYFAEHIFGPLGMTGTDLVRSNRVAARLATGYGFARRGPRPVDDRDWIGAGGGNAYSTPRDLARYAAALLGGGANEHGSILRPATVATMVEPHFQPDPRMPGMGLGFFRGMVAGHRVVGHDGIMPGFNSAMLLAPDDDVAVLMLTNGSPGAFGWLGIETHDLMASLLEPSTASSLHPVPQRPDVWTSVCGRYALQPPADLRQRLVVGRGAEVRVSRGHLVIRLLSPVPALSRGLPLDPADASDPYVFRVDTTPFGLTPVRVVFGDVRGGGARALHTDMGGQPWSLVRARRGARRARLGRLAAALAVSAGTITIAKRLPRR